MKMTRQYKFNFGFVGLIQIMYFLSYTQGCIGIFTIFVESPCGQRMMGQGMMGQGMQPGQRTDTLRESALKRLEEFDTDKDGTLSLSEFEALHAAMIRETTVDRFQHLDADGDGKITKEEVTAPAGRLQMRGMRNRGQGMMNKERSSDN